jgi:anaerobic ribonucleoside-triphosphate reductase
VLSNRYKDRRGGYVRILKNGFRASGSDRAPLALIELVNNPNDTVYHLAKKYRDIVAKHLEEVQAKKYEQKRYQLWNLDSDKQEEVVQLKQRQDLSGLEIKKWSRIEVALKRTLRKYDQNLKSYGEARIADEKSINILREKYENFGKPMPAVEVAIKVRQTPSESSNNTAHQSSTSDSSESKEEISTNPELVATPAEPPKSFMEKYFGKLWRK